MPEFADQTGRAVSMLENPQRIVSTVPSQTELLYDLGLESQIVGITAYCVHPKHFLKEKTVIGGTKDLNIEKIKSLKPDLIISNKEENVKEQIEELAMDFPIWLSDVISIDDALNMILEVGKITNRFSESERLVERIKDLRAEIPKPKSRQTAAYFIWKNPWMVASGNTFISSMMNEAGLENVFENSGDRYPEISLEELKAKSPNQILLSSEPYNFSTSEAHFLQKMFPKAKVKIVDGELYSWYGSRMLLPFKNRSGKSRFEKLL